MNMISCTNVTKIKIIGGYLFKNNVNSIPKLESWSRKSNGAVVVVSVVTEES
jgi:hypothetical protein